MGFSGGGLNGNSYRNFSLWETPFVAGDIDASGNGRGSLWSWEFDRMALLEEEIR